MSGSPGGGERAVLVRVLSRPPAAAATPTCAAAASSECHRTQELAHDVTANNNNNNSAALTQLLRACLGLPPPALAGSAVAHGSVRTVAAAADRTAAPGYEALRHGDGPEDGVGGGWGSHLGPPIALHHRRTGHSCGRDSGQHRNGTALRDPGQSQPAGKHGQEGSLGSLVVAVTPDYTDHHDTRADADADTDASNVGHGLHRATGSPGSTTDSQSPWGMCGIHPQLRSWWFGQHAGSALSVHSPPPHTSIQQ